MVAVIGDIHGCFFTLVELVELVRKNYPGIEIYSVGDLVDRGKNSYETVEFIINEKIKFAPGNHDYMFAHFFKHPTTIFARSWVFNGSESTLISYEKHEEAVFKHIEIIESAPLYYNLDDCFLSHAGVSSYYKSILPQDFKNNLEVLKPYIEQDYPEDHGVMWNRSKLLDLGKLQIVGHTKQKDVRYDKKANALYIDTGAYAGKMLSAVIIEQNKMIEKFSVKTNLNDLV